MGLVLPIVDLDAFVRAHRLEWDRLDHLVRRARRPGRLTGAEVDELVDLYQRTATHLSMLQSAGADAALLGKVSSLVARARTAVAGSRQAGWSDVVRFLAQDFPATLYRTRWWWGTVMVVCLAVGTAWGAYVAGNPEVQSSLVDAQQARDLVERDFENYYSSDPAGDFAARVFTNNAFIAAGCIASGVLLGLPVIYLLYTNMVSIGVVGGVMVANDRADLFFGLITPHGLLELTSVFVAGGLGLKFGWTVVDPGLRRRGDALAEEGRALVFAALGLTLLLFVSGLIEAFVTPSGLPTWTRIAIGVLAETLFLLWVFVLGRRAYGVGARGDIGRDVAGDVLPTAG
jgi:uncharacterized membrane protein SpoIIM required for sporulation